MPTPGVSYDPENLWRVGAHILPDMADRAHEAHRKIRVDLDEESAAFNSSLVEPVKGDWRAVFWAFRSRIWTSAERIELLGKGIQEVVLNHARTEQGVVDRFNSPAFREEVLIALADGAE